MDPISLGVNAGVSLLIGLISLVAYHKWAPAKAAAPAGAPPAPGAGPLASPLLNTAITHGLDILNQLASGAVKSGVSQIIVPALAKGLQQIGQSLEVSMAQAPAAAPPAPPTPAAPAAK